MHMLRARIGFLATFFLLTIPFLSPCDAQGAPQAPGNFRYTLDGSVLTLLWDASTGASGYRISAGFQPGIYVTTADAGNVTQLGPLDISIVPAATYYLAMKAFDSSGESPCSNEIAITWPPAPKNLRYALSGSQMTISWDSVAGASDYLLGVGFNAGTYAATPSIGNITQMGPFDISLVPNGTYYLALQAVVGGIVSEHSNEVVVKVGTTATQPVRISPLVEALFIGMGKYDPVVAPELTEMIISTFQSGGIDGLANLASSSNPQLVGTIANGILINYGSGYTNQWGDVSTGSVTITHSNVAVSGSRVTGNFSIAANNVTRNGVFIADGAVSGAIDATVGPGNTLVGDVTVAGTLSGSTGPAMVSGTAQFDTAVCPNYPIGGSLTVTVSGQPQTVTFNNRCNGTFDSGGNTLATLQQTTHLRADFSSWSRWDSIGVTPHYQNRTLSVSNYFSSTLVPLVWNGTSFSSKGALTGTTTIDMSGTVSGDGRTLLSLSAIVTGSFGACSFAGMAIPLSLEAPGVGATYLMSGPGLESHISGINVGCFQGYTYVGTEWTNASVPPTLTALFSKTPP